MQSRKDVKPLVATLITTISVVVFVYVYTKATIYSSNEDSSFPILIPKIDSSQNNSQNDISATDSLPVTLIIPKISVSSKVQYVGVDSKGNMAVPSNFSDVGWYKNGTVPGQSGTTVIDGHLDNALGLPAVFWHLSDLNLGDEIDIMTKDGNTLHFTVSQINTYNYDDPGTAVAIFSQEKNPTIRLITCKGSWVKAHGTYNKRLVVSATLS